MEDLEAAQDKCAENVATKEDKGKGKRDRKCRVARISNVPESAGGSVV